MGPVGGVGGVVYTDVSGPVGATSNTAGTKMGQATSTGIICVATGDSSIKTAAANGGITKISHVDYHTTSVLGPLCQNHSHRLRRIEAISETSTAANWSRN